MAFSGAVKLGDLNDFIAPSQACVVNLAPNSKLGAAELQVDTVQLPPTRADPKGFQQTQLAGDAVKVSLQDCLACSGCVTSAETVLLEHQSTGELLAALQSDKTVIMSVSPQSRASLAVLHKQSPTETAGRLTQFLKNLGAKLVLDTTSSRDIALLEAAQEFIARYTAKHPELARSQSAAPSGPGVCTDVDMEDRRQSHAQASINNSTPYAQSLPSMTFIPGQKPAASAQAAPQAGDSFSNLSHASSYNQTVQSNPISAQNGVPADTQHQTGTSEALFSVSAPQHSSAQYAPVQQQCDPAQPAAAQHDPGPLPMLTSACPGWVCYAEKTHGSYILPYISTTKSPQGSLHTLRHYRQCLWHLSFMSPSAVLWVASQLPRAVMGTLVKRFLAKQMGLDPAQIYHCAVMPCYDKKLEGSRDDFMIPGTNIPEVDSVLTTSEVQQLIEQQGVSFPHLPCSPMDSLLGPAAGNEQLHGVHGGAGGYLEFVFRTAAQQLFHRQLPAGPLQMKTLRNADFREVTLESEGRTALRFAAAYGFRNIQTLVRKIKRKACEYDYVEVMACPSGCLNGGGQIKAHKGQSTQQLLDELDQAYHAPELAERHPQDSRLVASVYQLLGGGLYGAAARDLLHTRYHHREKTVSAMIGDW